MIGIGEIVEGSKIDGIYTHGSAGDGHGGYDPVNGVEVRPSEPEEADGQESGFDAGEVETAFGGGEVDGSADAAEVFDVLPAGGEIAC